ncbi:hypothetical protein CSQ87_06935 [Bifidobacterium simiarum]|uniref:Uncharacterized protein n=1 Tax=Bifidobacterium simiarum TaxID=2045441 RepID=A0A2M9HDS3_9BIFI|nr:hypothetical protein CSQ87_06935 [Bifidobacterium simiarum]
MSDDEEARWLADYALSDKRSRPLLVITCPKGVSKPEIDPDLVFALTGDVLDIAVFGSNANVGGIDAFNDALAKRGRAAYGVYNGAVRFYPTFSEDADHAQTVDVLPEAPLYFVDTKPHREHAIDDLTGRLVYAGLLDSKPRPDLVAQVAQGFNERNRYANVAEGENRYPAHIIRNADQTRELIGVLLSKKRMMPIVVVAQSDQRPNPFVDVDLISNVLHDLALVAVLRSDESVAEFKRRIPRHAWVFGDAGRVFPAGVKWNDPDSPPRLFLPNEHVSRMLLTNLMMKDALINVADTLRRLSSLK